MNSFHYVRLPRTLNPILRGVVIKKRVVIVETFPGEFPKCVSESTPLFTLWLLTDSNPDRAQCGAAQLHFADLLNRLQAQKS